MFKLSAPGLTFLVSAALTRASAFADTAMPERFDPDMRAALQKLDPDDLQVILSFDSIGDDSGALPKLPVAMKGPDGQPGTADDLTAPEWIRLGKLLRSAQVDAARARADATERIGRAIDKALSN